MFDVFGSVKGLIKLDTFCIDNNIFRYNEITDRAQFPILANPK